MYVQVYHRIQKRSYSVLYNYERKGTNGNVLKVDLPDCSQINFPIKTFYSDVTDNFTTFFRQGECVTVPRTFHLAARQEKVTTADLGSMYLIYDEALITRSSNFILFFRINHDTGLWEEYHRINKMRGQIYFIKGNVRF